MVVFETKHFVFSTVECRSYFTYITPQHAAYLCPTIKYQSPLPLSMSIYPCPPYPFPPTSVPLPTTLLPVTPFQMSLYPWSYYLCPPIPASPLHMVSLPMVPLPMSPYPYPNPNPCRPPTHTLTQIHVPPTFDNDVGFIFNFVTCNTLSIRGFCCGRFHLPV